MSVCLQTNLKNRTFNLHQILDECCLWLWRDPHLAALEMLPYVITPSWSAASYCDDRLSVCLSVCLLHDSKTTGPNLTIVHDTACCLWPWLGPLLTPLRYVM